jgi:hypothetical protein
MTRIDDGHSTRIVFTLIRDSITSLVTAAPITFTNGGIPSGGTGGASAEGPGVPEGTSMWVREVTPPGMNGGGPNDTSNMHNTLMRTMAPKKLITATPMSAVVAYDPKVLNIVKRLINVNQQILVVYADLSYHEIWGWLNSFTPSVSKEGAPPEATIEIEPSNQDNSGNEKKPLYYAPGVWDVNTDYVDLGGYPK